ncbi:DHBP synthase RibB-like alpha/beta domain-containing protein [Dipodascopsis tothii]|uniref:DHBP synthase RibB-like alpha/beta domain-containing protein n=1 Tax=Dipodascopsis tothii TaxID=44089 RepID=UPI0034CD69B5
MAQYTTEVLPVRREDIVFAPGAALPTIDPATETAKNLQRAVDLILDGSAPLAVPTETVYGLGASALSTDAVRQIFRVKNRPSDNPLIVHVSSAQQIRDVLRLDVPAIYEPVLAALWPGPLTIIVPLPADPADVVVSPACTPGQNTVGVRMPSDVVARAVIALSNTPIAAPSANASTRPSCTTAGHVLHDHDGRIPLILDGGPCTVGVESTVLDGTVSPPVVLRPGGVSVEQIRAVGGPAWRDVVVARKTEAGKNEAVRTPGMKYRHYSPTARVVLFVGEPAGADGGAAVVGRYLDSLPAGARKIGLLTSATFDYALWPPAARDRITWPEELGRTGADISRNLFAKLREIDERGADVILVEGVGDEAEGLAIMNRLRKAASEIFEAGTHTVKAA